MLAEKLAASGSLQGVLEKLQDEIRQAPGDAGLRTFLFQVLIIVGDWERALRQLQIAATLDDGALAMARTYRELIRCELERREVFAGRRAPTLLGEPTEWVLLSAKALEHAVSGQHEEAVRAREEAYRVAPTVSGRLNDESFAWVADADSRLGPMLEVVVHGRYCWVPFECIESLVIDKPTDLRDLVWLPAHLSLRGQEAQVAFVPVRYPGSEEQADELRLARRTEWQEVAPSSFFGLGQRMLTTDQADYALLDIRALSFDEVNATSAAQ